MKRAKRNPEEAVYLKNSELLRAFLESREKGEPTAEFAKMLQLLAQRISRHRWFIGYSWNEELPSVGFMALWRNWHKFNPEKQEVPNPFSYFSTCCVRTFQAYCLEEYKHKKIKDALLIEHTHLITGYDTSCEDDSR